MEKYIKCIQNTCFYMKLEINITFKIEWCEFLFSNSIDKKLCHSINVHEYNNL